MVKYFSRSFNLILSIYYSYRRSWSWSSCRRSWSWSSCRRSWSWSSCSWSWSWRQLQKKLKLKQLQPLLNLFKEFKLKQLQLNLEQLQREAGSSCSQRWSVELDEVEQENEICWGWLVWGHHPRWASKQCTSSTPNGFRSTPRCPAHPSTEKWMRSLKDTRMHGQKGWSADAESGSIWCTLTIYAQTKASWSSSAAKYQRMGRILQGPCSGIASSKHLSSMFGVSFACSFTGTDKNASDALETSCGLRQDTNYFMKPGAKKEQLSRQVLERTRAPHEWGALRRECQDVRENVRQNVKLFARKDSRYCQIERQNKYAIYTSRWYVRSYVRIVVQGGDHSKKVILFCLCSLLGAGAHAIFFRGRQALFFVVWRGNDASLCFRMCVLEIYVAQKPQDTPGRSPPFCFWKRWNFGSIIFCV